MRLFIIIIVIYVILNFNYIIHTLYNIFLKKKNIKIYEIIYSMKYINIDINNIPNILGDKIGIYNIKNIVNIKDKKELISKILNKLDKKRFQTKNINVIDYLDFKTRYAYLPHTDIEWNLIENNGYQVWYLVKNDNEHNFGNMFILYNDYIFNKYKNISYTIRCKNNKIEVCKNCKYESKSEILEVLSIEWFKKNTQLFYLNLNQGDCLIFNKNICHMSDIRGNKVRHSINFRVVIDNINYQNCKCGFILNKTPIFKQ